VLFNAGMNKYFLLNPEKKNWCRSVLLFSRKNAKTHTLIPKNDVTEPKAIGYSNNQLKRSKLVKGQF